MSAWSERNGGNSAVAGSSGARTFSNTAGVGLPGGVGGVYHPPASGAGGPSAAGDAQPGVISINPLDPTATAQNAQEGIGGFFDGLRQALVGGNEGRDEEGFEDKSAIGGIPIVGDIGRGAANLLGGAGEVVGTGVNLVGGTLERLPSNLLGPGVPPQVLDAEYMRPEVQAWLDEVDPNTGVPRREVFTGDKGLLGTGFLSNEEHFKSAAIRAYREDAQYDNPSLSPGAFTPPGSFADQITNLFDGLSAGANVVARGWAGMGTPAQGGMNRLQLIMAVGDGKVAFESDKGLLGTGIAAGDPTTGLNMMEELIYTKVKTGAWSEEEALDFIASNGQAYGHSAIANIAGYMALDPLNIATLGAGAIAKVGLKGAQVVAQGEKAIQMLDKANDALNAAKAVRKGLVAGTREAKEANAAIRAAKAGVKEAEDILQRSSEFHSTGKVIRRSNVIAQLGEGSTKLQSSLRAVGIGYRALEGTNLGRAAKVTRTIIDPLHAIDLRMPGQGRMVDLYSDALPASVADTLGVQHYKGILDDSLRLDHTGGMTDQFLSDFAVASTNLGRTGIIDMFRANHMAGAFGDELMKTLPDDVFETAVKSTKQRDLQKWLRYNALSKVMQETWSSDDLRNLSKQLAAAYPARNAEEWGALLAKSNNETRSFYKFSAYGAANRHLLDTVANLAPEVGAKLPVNPGRMVLLAKDTLTKVNAEALLTRLTKAKTTKRRIELILEAQEKYPELRYISIDEANLGRSADSFIENLGEKMDRLPMQLTDDEIETLGSAADNLKAGLGEYKLGFRPADEFLWGLERENSTGLYRTATGAWADHVADGAMAYRPARALRVNIVGHPLVDVPVARAAIRAVDHIDSAARIMKSQVTGAMVTEMARKRFLASAANGDLAKHGVTERVASKWFDRIQEYTREHQGYSGPRGFGAGDLYNAIKKENLIPQPLLNGERVLNADDIMRMVMEAYDGDIRYIGLTQKLTARAKRYLFETTGSNWAGQIAEHAWPTMKFRYNPIFQLQEKIEPWVLNAQRGVSPAFRMELDEADRALEALLTRMTDNSLVRQADIDQAEYSAQVLFGKGVMRLGADPKTRLHRIQSMARQLSEVQGMKRINMLRTFKKGLGRELQAAWDEALPGQWDELKAHADWKAGKTLDPDDFALRMVSENLFSNDVAIGRLAAWGDEAAVRDFKNAVSTGEWYRPTHMGELRSLDLEHMAGSLRLVDSTGHDIKNLNELKAALATDPDMRNKVLDGLARLNADKDYIRRVDNALNFHWNGFWKTAAERFSLTKDESRALQDFMAEAAKLRGMTPVDFMSQVFSPSLIDGTEGVLGYLEGPARLLREARAAGRKVKARDAKFAETRTQLAGAAGVSSRDDLVRQLSAAFSAHLDPSAKRALLLEFDPVMREAVMNGTIKMDLQDIQNMWDSVAENELANRILGYMDGKLGSYSHKVIDDAAQGVADVRKGADDYMRQRGVTPHQERRYYDPDDAFSEETAAAYRDLPDTPYEKTGRKPTIRQVQESGTDLKPIPAGVDQRTYDAYQDFVIETRAQWDHMTLPKEKGGMGIKVIIAKGDPYPNSAAMRADVAKGRIRVFADQSDHPLMTNEQNVMFRAVHDVFGHAGEGFEFGPRGELNAAVKHSQMYSDTSRAAMLTETHGQNSYVNFSDDLVPGTPGQGTKAAPLDPNDPVGDFEARYPFEVPEGQAILHGPDDPYVGAIRIYEPKEATAVGTTPKSVEYYYSQRVGDGIRALPKDAQAAILQPMADLFDEFPELKTYHIEAVDFGGPLESPDTDILFGLGDKGGAFAMTFGADADEPLILFNKEYFHGDWKENWSMADYRNELSRQYDTFYRLNPKTGKVEDLPRRTKFGTGHNVGPVHPVSVMRHEAGHAYDVARRPHVWDPVNKRTTHKRLPQHAGYYDMIARFEKAAGRLDLSEYGFKSSAEFAAELFSYATDPELIVANIASPELRAMVEEWQTFMKSTDQWRPRTAAANPNAGMRVRDVNKAKPGTIYAPQKAGLLPQNVLDRFGEQFVGRGKHVESNPDVARVSQMFGKWTENVVRNGLLRGEDAVYSGLLDDIAGIPTRAAVPYNFSEGAAINLAYSNMTRKWDDAFRLQYFAQERTVLERSINHPMFGLYPASYMWGKIMPELVKFIAAEPFGNKTGGLLYSLMDVQAGIALRRETDPYFDANIEKMGHSQALSFAGYMMPTLPWDVSASAPTWMRSLSEQGTAQAKAREAGEDVKGLSGVDLVTGSFKKLVPELTTIPWAGRAIEELNGQSEEEAAKAAEDLDDTVSGAELSPVLSRVMQELTEALR